jgi:hypothetical protein
MLPLLEHERTHFSDSRNHRNRIEQGWRIINITWDGNEWQHNLARSFNREVTSVRDGSRPRVLEAAARVRSTVQATKGVANRLANHITG